MTVSDWLLLMLLGVGAFISERAGKLTSAAAITGMAAGFLTWRGAGYTGIAMLGSFFVLGVLATAWQAKQKQDMGLVEKNSGRRNAGQVMANAGAAAILGFAGWILPNHKGMLLLMIAAAFSSATADTLASELGNVYGSNYYNILSFKKDSRGENGVVSLEGTLWGMAGSTVIAMVYALGAGWYPFPLAVIIASGTAGNIFDSVLGALAERKGYIGNNTVNFLNTVFAALLAMLLVGRYL